MTLDIKSVLAIIEKAFFAISQLSLFAMMLLITSDTVGRYFFDRPIHGTLEVSELYLMGAVVFFSMSSTLHEGGHIRIELFFRNFSFLLKQILEVVFGTLSMLFFAAITYRASGIAYRAFINDEVVFGITDWPVYLSWLIVSIGSAMISLRLFFGIVQNMYLILYHIFSDK